MARVLGVFPQDLPYRIEEPEALGALRRWLPAHLPEREKLLRACAHTGVARRGSVLPLADVLRGSDFTERSRRYAEATVELGVAAASSALAAGPWRPERFHTLLTVSCTGVAIPPADVSLVERLGFPAEVRRMPFTELGCAGGASALAVAAEVVDARARAPGPRTGLGAADLALVLAAELPSLNFQPGDCSAGNVISSMLFGDAVVAAVLGPDGAAGAAPGWRPPKVAATRSHVLPRPQGLLGYELKSTGFHIVLSPEVPGLVRGTLGGVVDALLGDAGWSLGEIRHWVLHPAGRKVLQAALEALGLPGGAATASMDVLREHGNTSSTGVWLVLERVGRTAREGDRGLLVGLGPGFSTELALLQW
ncbi:MAG: hypothetical protein HY721_33910 [Planctomycetes bacterium]|nr:hypothetical protein [Planctomycetota bacterium]